MIKSIISISIFAAVLILNGCSRGDYVRPNTSAQTIKIDEVNCAKKSKRLKLRNGYLANKFAQESWVIDCMKSKGYLMRWEADKMKGKIRTPAKVEGYMKKCNQGDTISCFNAGWDLQAGRNGAPKNLMLATVYYKKACDGNAKNHTTAMRAKNLGCKYYRLLR